MLKKNKQVIAVLVLLALILTSGTQSCATRHSEIPGNLSIKDVNFDPSFITVGEHSRIKFSVSLTDNSPIFPSDELILEQQRFLPDGKSVFFPITELHDNGRDGDPVAADAIFTGMARFHEEASGALQLRVVAMKKHHNHTLVSTPFSIPVQYACGPTGNILPVKVFEGSIGKHQFESIKFNVPIGGKSILRLLNGARIGASFDERIAIAKVSVNGKEVETVGKGKNVIESTVSLTKGPNQLDIYDVKAKSGQRLSARIDACADTLKLKPVSDTQRVGGALAAEATLSGLGMPVENANIRFEFKGIGTGQATTASTSGSGLATTSFSIPAAGDGTLRASLIDSKPSLMDVTTINAVTQPSIELGQGRSEITIKTQEALQTPFFLYYVPTDSTATDGTVRHVTFTQHVEPATGGITLMTDSVPAGGFVAAGRNVFSVDETIQASTPGNYAITSTGTIQETGETASTTMTVRVVDPAAPGPLALGTPSANPPAVATAQKVKVTFLSLVSGTSTPPDMLFLDQVDATGQVLKTGMVQLKDDGQSPDEKSGDLAYTGSVELDASSLGERNYRVRAEYFGNTVTSSAVAFGVTPFPLEARPSDPSKLITVPENGAQIFADEVIAEFLQNVSPNRIEEIAAAAGTKVVGAIPTLRIYLLEIPGNTSFSGIQQVIATLQSFSEVKQASPNEKPMPMGLPNDPGFGNGAFTFCTLDQTSQSHQWYLYNIGAPDAWNLVGGGDTTKGVAIFDAGVNCQHADLTGQCMDVSNNPPIVGDHATELAGIIAAKADNSIGIAGTAYNTNIYPYSFDTIYNFLTAAIVNQSVNVNARVSNISQTVNYDSALQPGIDAIISSGRLVIASAGLSSNCTGPNAASSPQPQYPAAEGKNKPGLISVGATDKSNQLVKSLGSGASCSDTPVVELYAPGITMCTTNRAGSYHEVQGTSFATALTSGAAAVLWASMPSLTNIEVENRLKTKADLPDVGSAFGVKSKLNISNAIKNKNLQINFKSESAGFLNTFGYYLKDTKEAHILLEDVDIDDAGSPNTQLVNNFKQDFYSTNQGIANIGFFLIPNGYSQNQAYFTTYTPVISNRKLVVQLENGNWRVRDEAAGITLRGSPVAGQTNDAYFTDPSLNPGGEVHIRKQKFKTINDCSADESSLPDFNPDLYVMCWEDQPFSVSDKDYNDSVLSITITPQ
ncbi:MAG: S8 family serine peptidase [Methylococcaceae bacterium]